MEFSFRNIRRHMRKKYAVKQNHKIYVDVGDTISFARNFFADISFLFLYFPQI